MSPSAISACCLTSRRTPGRWPKLGAGGGAGEDGSRDEFERKTGSPFPEPCRFPVPDTVPLRVQLPQPVAGHGAPQRPSGLLRAGFSHVSALFPLPPRPPGSSPASHPQPRQGCSRRWGSPGSPGLGHKTLALVPESLDGHAPSCTCPGRLLSLG